MCGLGLAKPLHRCVRSPEFDLVNLGPAHCRYAHVQVLSKEFARIMPKCTPATSICCQTATLREVLHVGLGQQTKQRSPNEQHKSTVHNGRGRVQRSECHIKVGLVIV